MYLLITENKRTRSPEFTEFTEATTAEWLQYRLSPMIGFRLCNMFST